MLIGRAIFSFTENADDVQRLIEIHGLIAGKGPGRKSRVEILNKSAIVFLTACWESYIEDVAIEAFEVLISKARKAKDLPKKVRCMASKPLREDKDESQVWLIADKGWRDVLRAHKEEAIKRWIGKFNTPNAGAIDELMLELLGLNSLTSHWRWKGMSSKKATAKLDSFVAMRGNIAHRTKHVKKVYLMNVRSFRDLVLNLVEATNGAIHRHLRKIIKRAPRKYVIAVPKP